MRSSLLPLLLLLCSLAHTLAASEEEVRWLSDYEEAVAESKATDKPVFLLFTNSYSCGPCIRLEHSVLSTPEFAEFSRTEIVPLKVDFAPIYRDKNTSSSHENLYALRHQQNIPDNLESRGWPYLILFHPNKPAIYHDQLRPFKDFNSMVEGIGMAAARQK